MYEFECGNETYNLCLDTLIDTGSPISFVRERFISDRVIRNCHEESWKFKGINGTELKVIGQISINVRLEDIVKTCSL